MMSFFLRQEPDPLGKRERLEEVCDFEGSFEPVDVIDLHQLPVGHQGTELGDLFRSYTGRVAAACHAPFGGQRCHHEALLSS